MSSVSRLVSRCANRPRRPLPRFRNRLEFEILEERHVPATSIWQVGAGVFDPSETFLLHSVAGARQVVYLDFDGHTNGEVYNPAWNGLSSPAWDPSGDGPTF